MMSPRKQGRVCRGLSEKLNRICQSPERQKKLCTSLPPAIVMRSRAESAAPERTYLSSSSSTALASFKSAVSKPSVNQP